ncbi:ATP-binding protein [Pseudomonas syringae group genomosp. 3]|uniref:ATP-binding protein n=1 Tax=Pseudomonas syringae group genomosp. 3 TaxID=251701 RepID=UPI000EFCF7F7|nr:ATP-binding protein [Pseudomonas syringae group genomosp. 3]
MSVNRDHDTIVRWIALTIVVAMFVSLVVNVAFIQIAGVWASPPLAKSGLLESVALSARIIETAAPASRPDLALAASERALTVRWLNDRSQLELTSTNDDGFDEGQVIVRRILGDPLRVVEGYRPDEWKPRDGNSAYLLLIQLKDKSWLAYTTPSRTWGVNQSLRYGLILLLGLLTSFGVAWLATRRLARPLQAFAEAARHFAGNFSAAPVVPTGPEEIRHAMVAFNSMQAQIQTFVADRTHMLAAISHDLRAPLTRMRLRGEFVEDPEQQRKLFNDVDEMQLMINAALEFFRDDARLEQSTVFDLAELLKTLIDDYRDQGIDITFTGPDRLVFSGHPSGLKRVVTNLLENAIKYAKAPAIELQAKTQEIIIGVSDDGPGIPESDLHRVFDPFYRVESSRNKNSGGVGLGLSAARGIARKHGGELIIRNRREGGLLARLSLPRTGSSGEVSGIDH